MASSSLVCWVTYSAATPVVLSISFAPPLNVMPGEPLRKWRYEDSSEDYLKMLATFVELWAACKRSFSISECLGPLLAS